MNELVGAAAVVVGEAEAEAEAADGNYGDNFNNDNC